MVTITYQTPYNSCEWRTQTFPTLKEAQSMVDFYRSCGSPADILMSTNPAELFQGAHKWCRWLILTSPTCHPRSVLYTIKPLMIKMATRVGYTFTGVITPWLKHTMRATMATMLYLRSCNPCHGILDKYQLVCIKISWGCTDERLCNLLVSCPLVSYTLVLCCDP